MLTGGWAVGDGLCPGWLSASLEGVRGSGVLSMVVRATKQSERLEELLLRSEDGRWLGLWAVRLSHLVVTNVGDDNRRSRLISDCRRSLRQYEARKTYVNDEKKKTPIQGERV